MNKPEHSSDPEDLLQKHIDQAGRYTKSLQTDIARALRLSHAKESGQELDPDDAQFLAQIDERVRQGSQALLHLLPAEEVQQKIFSPLELMVRYWEQQAERREMATTGFATLNDALSGGLERDRLYVLLGAPGSGKTTLANQLADHLAHSRPVLYVSSEDTPMTLLAKTIARRSMIEYSAVLRGYQSERDRIDAAFAEYRETPSVRHLLYLDATQGIGLQDIADHAERHFEATRASTKGDPVIVVDYLQRLVRAEDMLLRAKSGGQGGLGIDVRQAATVYTERLRQLACDLHCSVICLSAMNRASGYSADGNVMSAAKESGDIEYTADVILAIGRQTADGAPITLPEHGAFPWCLTVAKNRQGMSSSTGARILLAWYPTFQKFVEREDTPSDDEDSNNGRYRKRKA